MKKFALYFLSLILISSCGISEDCFKGNGNQVVQTYLLENFTKIKVYNGVGLVLKEGANYEVKVVTSNNILNDIEIKLNGDMLVVKDNSTCNIARDYGQTTVYVTIPDGTFLPLPAKLELHSKTEQKIQSEGILHSPIIRLFSLDDSDGVGTGDFDIAIENQQVVVESNTVSNYYLKGNSNEMIVNFYLGDGRLNAKNLQIENIKVYHRGSNDMFVYPVQKIEGIINATGNVVLENIPPIIDVEEVFRGRVIYY
ncbi:MAG TPA: hypothetical protein DDZ41_07490 [Flavobacterium sp.]|nr:hypothetical protein [Flavobacterium sp.]